MRRMSFRAGRRSVRLALVTIVVLAVAAGVAYATIPDSSGVFTACKLNATGTIRLIDPSLPESSLLSHCTRYEAQISWNQTGQPGPRGPQGEPGAAGTNGTNGVDGAPGAPGLSGVEYRTTSLTVANQSFDTVTALCPGSKQAIAGGFRQTTAFFDIQQSSANSTGTGWSVRAFNTGPMPGSGDLTAFVVCAFVN